MYLLTKEVNVLQTAANSSPTPVIMKLMSTVLFKVVEGHDVGYDPVFETQAH